MALTILWLLADLYFTLNGDLPVDKDLESLRTLIKISWVIELNDYYGSYPFMPSLSELYAVLNGLPEFIHLYRHESFKPIVEEFGLDLPELLESEFIRLYRHELFEPIVEKFNDSIQITNNGWQTNKFFCIWSSTGDGFLNKVFGI